MSELSLSSGKSWPVTSGGDCSASVAASGGRTSSIVTAGLRAATPRREAAYASQKTTVALPKSAPVANENQ